MGGYLAQFGPLLPTGNQVKNIASVYRTPLIEVATKCVFTNTSHVSAYRGAGRPEGNYYVERALDVAASELGIDRIELRKRNMIRKSDLPFKAASGMTYDCGDFLGVLKQALEMADYAGFNKRKRESRKNGQTARLRRRLLSRSHRRARQGNGRHPFRSRRHGDIVDRHHGFRHGPRHDLCADAQRHARRAVRSHPHGRGRQRPHGFRRRLRRFALGDVCRRCADRIVQAW